MKKKDCTMLHNDKRIEWIQLNNVKCFNSLSNRDWKNKIKKREERRQMMTMNEWPNGA